MEEARSPISLRFYTQKLHLHYAFGIARSTRTHIENVFVEIECDGFTGIGEASPNSRYNESAESACEFLKSLQGQLPRQLDMKNVSDWIHLMQDVNPGEYAAKVAVEMAVWDWIGKKIDLPLYELWNLNPTRQLTSSMTIGIDSPEVIGQKVKEAKDAPILKVKLGTDQDREIIKQISSLTDAELWVDANEGWKNIDQAREMIRFLSGYNVGLVEQPMPSTMNKKVRELRSMSDIPLIADESCTGSEALDELAECFDGINIKLMKVGSMRKAFQMIDRARELGMKVMIGCMLETAVANTAGALLSLRADYADLDGWKLLKDRPFSGMTFDSKNKIILPDGPGLGVS